ncbi:MAG: iron complex outerrane recepter protein [Gammaproteobacteria bacterium]|nr:iron complex outerrane recepter protein [Gammaproteobacteria bacterium]
MTGGRFALLRANESTTSYQVGTYIMRRSHGDEPRRRTDCGRAFTAARRSWQAVISSSLLLLGPALGSGLALAQNTPVAGSAAQSSQKEATRLASNDTAPAASAVADAAEGPAASAGEPAAEAGSSDAGVQEVVVTGSHIARSDYDSPQPVTAISAASLEAAAPANIIDFAVTLPALAGSTTVNNSSGALSNGEAGVAALNLRNLGTARTLVLVDGQRWAPSTIEGLVDINTIPQSLITGIDVTTGGASAAYGSGAVGGVVNFILNKKFTGVKADYQYSEYQLYDDPQNKFTLTAGTGFADGRGHVLFSGEVFGEQGNLNSVPEYDKNGYFSMPNTAANIAAGGPQVLVGPHMGLSTLTPGGLITSGPLKGTYFGVVGANGVPSVNQLAYGSPVNGQWMQGGDWKYTDSAQFGSTALIPRQRRASAFGRLSFELNDSTEVYSELSWARYHGFSYYDAPTTTGISISVNNPFLPASVVSAMHAANVPTFTMGTSNAYFGPAASDTVRSSERANIGADGSFHVFGQTWKWDTHALIAQTADIEELPGTYNNANFANAINAIAGPNGPVCASAAAQAAGCVPLNIFGVNPVQSAAARAYVLGDPTRHEWFQLDEGAANFSTNDFAGWAGPISLAIGAEGRREAVTGNVPVQYDPTYGNYWKYGNYVATHGSYTVAEGYVETLIPVLKGLNFNGAARYTSYSTSGGTDSWKLGLTYSPIRDITFRATRSADIRAGNLAELFSPGTARTNSVTNDFDNNNSLLFVQKLEGSTKVQPETAKTDVLGVVFQPRAVPGLQASVDYYSIKIYNLISDLTAQQEVDACYFNKIQKYCDNLLLNGFGLGSSGASTPVIVQVYENLYRLNEKGMDFEASYPVDLSSLWSPLGQLTFHAIATHYINYTTNNGVTAVNLAGSNAPGNATPNWMGRLETMYIKNSWTFDVVSRVVSPGNLNDASDIYIQCAANCKAGTGVYKTANVTSVPGQIVFDGTISKKFDLSDRGQANVYLMVRNLLNRQPPVIAGLSSTNYGAENVPAYPQTNTYLYDYLGREFTLGVKVQF